MNHSLLPISSLFYLHTLSIHPPSIERIWNERREGRRRGGKKEMKEKEEEDG